MHLSFRQGIVRYQTPTFLSIGGSFVSLVVTDIPCIITFADGPKDYLYVEQTSVSNAWGPITPAVDQWLFWDIDRRTGTRTFGITLVQPIAQPSEPPSPAVDQHWFDTSVNQMKVWNGTRWLDRLRVFACELSNGSVPISMSINSPLFDGTQAGLTVSDNFAGQILFDANTGQPLKTPDHRFITTEDRLTTRTISLSDIKLAALVLQAEAQQNMAAYTVVRFTDFDEITFADALTASQLSQFGIIEQDVLVGDFTQVTLEGVITNPVWDWPTVNAPLYADSTGQLVDVPPVPNAGAVAMVVGRQAIIFGSPKNTFNTFDVIVDLATAVDHGLVRLNIPPTSALDPVAVGANDPRVVLLNGLTGDVQVQLDGKVDLAGDTMTGFLTLNADPTAALHAATKQYVDNTTVALAGDTMTGFLTLNADPTAALHAATKQYVDASSGGGAPANEVVYGTGVGTTSSPTFKFDPTGSGGGSAAVFVGVENDEGTVQGFNATTLDFAGGAINLMGGSGNGTGGGGGVAISGGTASSGPGGSVSISGGSVGTEGDGGSIFIAASSGTGTGVDRNGGEVSITSGSGIGVGNPGDITLNAGSADILSVLGSTGGNIYLVGGMSSNPSGSQGGQVVLTGGPAGTDGTGGAVAMYGGSSIDNLAGEAILKAGDSSGSGNGGMATVQAGGSLGTGSGGIVFIDAGVGIGGNGSILMRTSAVPRLEILGDGDWSLAGDSGTLGQVLTSNGVGTPPTWQAGGGSAEPANQIVYGTGLGTDSSPNFTYSSTNSSFLVNTLVASGPPISAATFSTFVVGIMTPDNTVVNGSGGYINLQTGAGDGTGQGGSIILTGGAGGATSGLGGGITMATGAGGGTGSGGNFLVTTGGGNNGGTISLTAGSVSTALGIGGSVFLTSGSGSGAFGQPGSVQLVAGDSPTTGGSIFFTAGDATGVGDGGNITLTAGTGSGAPGTIVLASRYAERRDTPAIGGGTLTIDMANGNHFGPITLDQNITTLTVDNVPTTASSTVVLTMTFIADGTLRTIAWPASFKWPGGTAPTMTSTLNKIDVITATSYDSGATWLATATQNF